MHGRARWIPSLLVKITCKFPKHSQRGTASKNFYTIFFLDVYMSRKNLSKVLYRFAFEHKTPLSPYENHIWFHILLLIFHRARPGTHYCSATTSKFTKHSQTGTASKNFCSIFLVGVAISLKKLPRTFWVVSPGH